MPPPRTSMRFGMSFNSSAPVESITRSSSGMKGSATGSDPAAMMHWSKLTVVTPASPSTSIMLGPVNLPYPRTTSTLRPFDMPARPPVSLPTTSSLKPRRASRSISGLPKDTPWLLISSASVITLATCSSAFEGIQPTFRQTPPRVGLRSIRTVFNPRSAARNAAV